VLCLSLALLCLRIQLVNACTEAPHTYDFSSGWKPSIYQYLGSIHILYIQYHFTLTYLQEMNNALEQAHHGKLWELEARNKNDLSPKLQTQPALTSNATCTNFSRLTSTYYVAQSVLVECEGSKMILKRVSPAVSVLFRFFRPFTYYTNLIIFALLLL
jgi:hypothetical protein